MSITVSLSDVKGLKLEPLLRLEAESQSRSVATIEIKKGGKSLTLDDLKVMKVRDLEQCLCKISNGTFRFEKNNNPLIFEDQYRVILDNGGFISSNTFRKHSPAIGALQTVAGFHFMWNQEQ